MSTWTDELKAKAIASYLKANPTPETTASIVEAVAKELGQSPNGVRAILAKSGDYVKSAAKSTKAASGAKEKTGEARVSKADAIEALVAAINDLGQEPDMEIIDKLTGKAAQYFTTVIRTATVE
jgi:transposase-like protein